MSTDQEIQTAQPGAQALLMGRDRKRPIIRLVPGAEFHAHRRTIAHDDLIGSAWGTQAKPHLGKSFVLLRPSTDDLLRNLKRSTQTVYSNDAGYILAKLNIAPGCRVIEAGTGSGGLTVVLARAVQPDGRVISYASRLKAQRLAQENVERLGLGQYVVFRNWDITDGFGESEIDALLLDLANPWDYLCQAHAALTGGGFLGSIIPTAHQVILLINALESAGFGLIEVEELILRPYKTVAVQLRPKDRLTPHTGYLVFARKLIPSKD